MSELGQKATSAGDRTRSALPPTADIAGREHEVSFGPEADLLRTIDHLISQQLDNGIAIPKAFRLHVDPLSALETIHAVRCRSTYLSECCGNDAPLNIAATKTRPII
jgi:hypothetical protein